MEKKSLINMLVNRWSFKEQKKEKPILKQFGELRNIDFDSHPVWVGCHCEDYDEDWYDDTDEETFRPWKGKLPIEENHWMFLARADFVLADGTELKGFISPVEEGTEFDTRNQQPNIITDKGDIIGFWYGALPRDYFEEDMKSTYSKLGKRHEEIFPIRCSTSKELSKGKNTGVIYRFERIKEQDEI